MTYSPYFEDDCWIGECECGWADEAESQEEAEVMCEEHSVECLKKWETPMGAVYISGIASSTAATNIAYTSLITNPS